MANNSPESAPSPDSQAKAPGSKSGSNWPIWGGLGAAILAIIAVAVWALWPKGIIAPLPVTPTPTPIPPTVVVVVPSQTPLAGVATFTPVADTIITGPHVLGITAGVGMHGDIAGVAPIAVTFSDRMDQPAAQAAFSLSPSVNGDFKWTENTLVFTPRSPLKSSTDYTVAVSTNAKTQSGTLIAAPMSASFKTAPPPSILRTLPSAGASEVPTDAVVTISFNRPMIPLTALDSQPDPGQWVSIQPVVKGRWVWLGTAAVGFRADTGFQPATTYTVEAKAGWPDENGVALSQGVSAGFTTIKPAIMSVEPYNGQDSVPLDPPIVVHFNMPMDHATQANFHLTKPGNQSGLPGVFEWSADSTTLTYTAASLLDFSTEYTPLFSQNVVTANGVSTELAGGDAANTWSFNSTDSTRVSYHSPNNDSGPAQPSNGFAFSFNNPLGPNQPVEQYLTINPKPEGYIGQLTVTGSSVSTDSVKLLPNTTYKFTLSAGLKDKWGFPVEPSSWDVQIGPLPPALAIKGGTFQPVYVDGPTRVQVSTANLSSFTFHLRQLSEGDMRTLLTNPPYYQPTTPTYPGQLKREWQVSVLTGQSSDGTSTFYPSIALDGNGDRLPTGYYLLYADAPNPYGNDYPLYSATVLIVGRTGLVTKSDGQNLMLWAADLGTGKPVGGYSLRIEQIKNDSSAPTVQTASTGQDGVARLVLNRADNVSTVAIFAGNGQDALFATTNWNFNINPYDFSGVSSGDNSQTYRANAYVDRPIYRPVQTVYYHGVYRFDDDASYTLPNAGDTVEVRAFTYGNNGSNGPTAIYTGTAALSAQGTVSGQFLIPADAPVGSYTLAFSQPGSPLGQYDYGVTSASFEVQEYRKPDFQVGVTSSSSVVHGDPVTATINTSYYFGGPLQNVTTTVNIQASPYYFYWADPKTGETYKFGEYNPIPYDFYSPIPYSTPEPVQSFKARTDSNGVLNTDVTRYITTTNGSKSVLIEGQVQDLSNQTVAANSSTVVHQGLYYVGLRTEDYIATAKQPTTITVRTVEWSADKPALSGAEGTHPNAQVSLSFVRHEWAEDASGQSKQNDVPAGQASVTTDAQGRATYLFTPPSGGEYGITAESVDSRGNTIRTVIDFYASDDTPSAGYIPWRFKNDQQITLVADKDKYEIGDTARILVTSPFTQATGLLTIERGHVRRYQIINIQGGSPTIEVPLQAGDLPNVYVGLTLLGPERAPDGAPADWGKRVVMRQGYVNLSLDTSSKELQVSLAPDGKGPFKPGSTASVKVTTKDKAGNPVQGDISLAVVDEAIFAIGGENGPALFNSFWSERGLGVSTSSSFTSGDVTQYGYGGGGGIAEGAVPAPSAAAPQAQDGLADNRAAKSAQAPAAPQKVRTNFQDTAFWQADVATGQDGTATVSVPLPDNLTTWRLTTAAITGNTLAGGASAPLTVTQPLLLTPILPRFLTVGDQPHPQAVIHNNTALDLDITASLEVSGAVSLDKSPAAEQTLKLPAGQATVVTWSGTVAEGDTANFRFWVHTGAEGSADYLEDALAQSIPVKPFAAPEVVATSGEVTGLRSDESVFIPYSVNPLLGQLVIQVSPSLAAATTSSINYVEQYEYESTDQTVSRFLPLVVLEKVYNNQGFTTPYSKQIPDILASSIARLRDLEQPDGGWAWWERGPSDWFETAYVVQGLAAARDAGYAIPDDMLQRGIQSLQSFQSGNNTQGIDETYHLNMRAYSLYVLAYATTTDDSMKSEGSTLATQTSRLSVHARAWLAMAMGKMGMSSESKTVLDSLASAARQSSTTAHWEEGRPDYWSMGTDNRATALAIDALVTLTPNDPLVPKAVRWLMTAEKGGHWLSTQETSISLVALAHYIAQSKELGADYTFQLDAFGKTLGQGIAASTNLTQTQTFTLPVSQMPVNSLGDLGLSRSTDKGKMYYQMSLRYYVPGEGIKSKSEGLAITRSYYKVTNGVDSAEPVKEVSAGDLVKVRLTIVAPETSYYVLVTDPLPAGLEGVNGSLNTTSFTERPPSPTGTIQNQGQGDNSKGVDYAPWYFRWGPFDNVEMRDDRTVLFATYMSPGTYVYEYYARATTPGQYMALPSNAELMYYPDVFGHSDGGQFTVK